MPYRRYTGHSLLARALFSNFLLITTSAVLLAVIFLVIQRAGLQRQVNLRAAALADFVAAQSEFGMLVGDRSELDRIAHTALSIEGVLFVVMTDKSGDSIRLSRPGFDIERIPAGSFADENFEPLIRGNMGRRFLEVGRSVQRQEGSSVVDWERKTSVHSRLGAVRVGFSMEYEDGLMRKSLGFGVPLGILSLLTILAVQHSQLRRLLEPLKGLIDFTKRVGAGDLSGRAPVRSLDEVGRLTESFNRMVEQLGSTTVSKNYVDDIIRSMAESLIVIDCSGAIEMVNQATVAMLGYTEEELVGRPAAEIMGSHLEEGLAPSDTIEWVYRCKDGKSIPVLVSSSALRDGCSEIWIAQDITDRKLSRQRLVVAKEEAERANRAKSEFLSRTSHELRTPLNAILGFGQLLELARLEPDDRESIDQIMKAGLHLLKVINEVLDIAGIETGRRTLSVEPVNVIEALMEATDMARPLAAQRNIDIRLDIRGCGDQYVLADRQRLHQVLLNLLSNATKYNRDNGRIIVASGMERPRTVRIEISDTGHGIAPEAVAKLFTPFERLSAAESGIEGTGLGLAVSKNFVEAMGGSIGVEPAVEGGCTFWVELRATEAPEAKQALEPDGKIDYCPAMKNAATILYVEDNLTNLTLVKRMLKRLPAIDLLSAIKGEEGLRLASVRRPDLILLDLHLPDMSGASVLRALKEHSETRDIPVVMLTADATPGQAEALLAAGACRYLTKPVEFQKLVETIAGLLPNREPTYV